MVKLYLLFRATRESILERVCAFRKIVKLCLLCSKVTNRESTLQNLCLPVPPFQLEPPTYSDQQQGGGTIVQNKFSKVSASFDSIGGLF